MWKAILYLTLISGFRRDVDVICGQDGTDMLSRNVGK
jgi:hypothetical protein